MTIANLFSLLTGMVLFLYGMSVMGDALKRAAGSQLELLLSKLTSSSLKGILLGAGVTAIIQSSSATSVMAVGFVNSGVMKLRQAVGIILGAILGTSVTGWIIALSELGGGSGWVALFSTETLTGIVAVAGFVLHAFIKNRSNAGDILLGFAVLMVGIGTMSTAVAPLQESPAFVRALTMFSNPFLGILAGALFTAVLQSASAAVGVLQTLSVTGAIDFSTAFPILLGISIGASLPVLLSALGAGVEGKRTAMVYLLISVLGAAICGGAFYALNAIFPFPYMDTALDAVSIALVNTLFRLANVLILWPMIGGIEKLAALMVREQTPTAPSDAPEPIELEDRFLPYPSLAIAQAQRAIDDMARSALESVGLCFEILKDFSEERVRKVEQLEHLANQYEDRIGTYLMKVSRNPLSRQENADVFKYLHTLTDFERITDYAVQIAIRFKEDREKSVSYPDGAVAELSVVQDAVREMVDITVAAFTANDWHTDGKLAALNVVIRALCHKIELKQVGRMQSGVCSMEQGASISELLADYTHIVTHCSKIVLAMAEVHADSYRMHPGSRELDLRNNPAVTALAQYRKKYTIGSENAVS